MLFDKFHYRYGDAEWGDAVSPVRLAPDIGGNPVPVHGRLEIERRLGSDIAPVDIAAAEERLRLKSYIWADQTTRLQRLDAALAALPAIYREAILLVAVDEMKPAEAAAVCGISPEAMRQRISRARAMLTRHFDQSDAAVTLSLKAITT